MTKLIPQRVAITGASGGIGRALALYYAQHGATALVLAGRNEKALRMTASLCENAGAAAEVGVFDVRDAAAFDAWVDRVTAADDLTHLIFCHGVSSSVTVTATGPTPETTWEMRRELDVNAVSTVSAANRAAGNLLPQLRETPGRRVQIGLTASLAALTGLPSSPAYSASKAAVVTFGEALRRLTRGSGLGVTVALPGFVTSPMSRRYLGKKPFEVTAENAAQRIAEGLDNDRRQVVFPKVLAWGMRLLAWVPERWQGRFLAPFAFAVADDAETRTAKEASWQ